MRDLFHARHVNHEQILARIVIILFEREVRSCNAKTIHEQSGANKTDAGNGSKAICRISNVLRSPSPDPRRWAKKNMKLAAFFILLILNCTYLKASDRDVRVDVIKHLISELNPEKYPRIAIVKEVCSLSKSFTRLTRDELRAILDDSSFKADHLIPVGNVKFPDSETPGYHDSQSGLGLFLFSITRITLRDNGLFVDYIIDSGVRIPGFNYPSDGNFEIGTFKITYEDGSRHLEHLKFTEPDHREAPNKAADSRAYSPESP